MINTLLRKTKFPEVVSVKHELKKVAILRIILGFIIFVRFFQILQDLIILEQTYLILFGVVLLVLISLFTIGLFTPIVTLLIIILINTFDKSAHTATLGTSILTLLLIVMFLINHGIYGSIDSILLKNKGKIGLFLKYIYNILGQPTTHSIQIAYFFGFLTYALTSLAALLLHIYDPYWVQGLTLQSALTNSYLFKFYDLMRITEELSPNLFYISSAIGVILQSVFQILMIPLIFFNFGRKFIIFWGFIFFIISLIGINLSYLPHVEIIYWLLIFCIVNPNNGNVYILYDDTCGLCTKGIKVLQILNFNGKCKFLGISNNKKLYESKGLTEENVYTYMAGWKDKQVYTGFNLYLEIFKINPILWIALPILILGKINKFGEKLYNYIAKNRYKIFGVCEIGSKALNSVPFEYTQLSLKKYPLKIIHNIYLLILIIFILFKYPTGISNHLSKSINSSVNKYLYLIGLQVPGVFNNTDLSMGDSYLVLHRKVHTDFELVPITGLEGNRLTYSGYDMLNFSNHNSDLFYFGNTLRYRRTMININDENLKEFHTIGLGYTNLKKRIVYDYYRNNFEGDVTYSVDVYRSSSSHVKIMNVDKNRHNSILKYTAMYIYNGNNLLNLVGDSNEK